MDDFGFLADGYVEIQDGIYIKNESNPDPKFRRGLVRQDQMVPIVLEPSFVPKLNNQKTIEINVSCRSYASIYSEGLSIDSKIIIEKKYSQRKVSGKNLFKDVKDSVCRWAGKKQASLIRKRLIGLQKIHKTISNEQFKFIIE